MHVHFNCKSCNKLEVLDKEWKCESCNGNHWRESSVELPEYDCPVEILDDLENPFIESAL